MTAGVTSPGAEFTDDGAILAMREIDAAFAEYEQLPVLAELRAGASRLVRSSGYVRSPVMLIGEAPGADEDREGMPFVGRSGRLLDELLAGHRFPRGLCYVTNVIGYRPPGNRPPHAFEIASSRRRLMREISAVCPLLVVTLGATARKALVPDGPRITDCHGQVTDFLYYPAGSKDSRTAKMLPAFHPSAALRDPAILEQLKADLSFLAQFAPQEASGKGYSRGR